MARAAEGLRVCSEQTLRAQVREYVDRGRLTTRQARALLGYLACESVGINQPTRTRSYHRADLRKLGLAQALDGIDHQADELDVDLGELLAEALTSEKWSRD
jgi:hypothetical protein